MPKKPTSDLLDASALKHAAVDLLARRDHSRHELWQKLSPKAASDDDLTALLDDLSARDWQSDARYASTFLRSREQRGLGPIRIRQELRQRGVSNDLINAEFEQSDTDWYRLANEVAAKKAGSVNVVDAKGRAKLQRFLAYRGFSSDHIYAALDALSESGKLEYDNDDGGWI